MLFLVDKTKFVNLERRYLVNSSIEGSKLNQKEVNELLEKDKWPDKSKEDIAEAYGVDEAAQYKK